MLGKESDARRQQNPTALLAFAPRIPVVAFMRTVEREMLGGAQKKGPCAPVAE
jgi:hypothetical protein